MFRCVNYRSCGLLCHASHNPGDGHLALQSTFEQGFVELVEQTVGAKEGFGRAMPFEQLIQGFGRKHRLFGR